MNCLVLEKEIDLDCGNVKILALITNWRSHKINGGLHCASLDDDSNNLSGLFHFVFMKKMCKEKTRGGGKKKKRKEKEKSPGPLLGQFVRTLLEHFFHNGERRRCN